MLNRTIPFNTVDLSTTLNAESLAPMLTDPDVRQCLSQFLPEVNELTNSEDEVKETIQSPQFRQVYIFFSYISYILYFNSF